MPFWKKSEPNPDQEDLRARIRALDDDVHALRRDLKSVQVDWDGTFAKFQALYARLAKQARKAALDAEDDPETTNGKREGVQAGGPGTAHLAARFRRH